ncbi:MAG: amidohydrolase family protein, partial [Oscillospiraceae bacterium]|nr:amidohydrolase family protein [Oscillospiraceae bacterium]
MNRTRFYNGKICTMENDASIIEGELWTKDGKVEYAGAAKSSDEKFGREIDLAGNLLLPGFKNAHTHSAMTFLRSYADDLPLLEWLYKQVFPMEDKLCEDDVYHLSKLAIMEYLTSGITANFDMYMFMRTAAAKASIDCGFRTVFCGAANNFGTTPEQWWEDYGYLNVCHELIGARLGFHAEYTCDKPLLERVAKIAHDNRLPVYCHNSEGRPEVDQCIERTGKTPTAYLDSIGLFEYGGGGFHCVYLNDEDIEIFRRRGMFVISCPASNVKLASGIAPLKILGDRGVRVALGTDGPASNNALDFFREMFLAATLQKIREDDASVMDAAGVLRMATTAGALA